MRWRNPTCPAVWLAFLCSMAGAQGLYPEMGEPVATLVEKGEAKCGIVLGDPKGQRPAEELAAYLEKISGVKPPIATDGQGVTGYRVRVGGPTPDEAEWQSLPGDGYVIRSSPQELHLTGKTELGIFYAVDTFLEKHLGVRWFMPGEVGESVPRTDTIRIGKLSEAGKPVFRLRWIGRGDWARRNKMNVSVKCDGEFKIQWFVHTFTRLIPPEKYYAEHPEYFALIGGKRVTKRDAKDQIQICTSNPDVVRETAANVIKLKDEDPTLSMVSVDPMDTQRFCECEACKAQDEEGTQMNNCMTRRLLLFYNAVSDLVGAEYPDLFLKSIAYHKYVAPPLDKALRVRDNCVIQFCRFTCHNHALEDPDCPYNREFNKYIKGWRAIAKNVCLYEYFYKVSWLQLPWPIVHMLREDMPYFQRLRLFGLATQYHANYGSNGLGYYVAAKLAWDPSLNVDALLEDFYTRFYGPASGPMRRYYETLEAGAIASGVHLAKQRPYPEILKLFTPELLGKLEACVAEAEKAAMSEKVDGPADPLRPVVGDKVRARIAMVRASLEHAKASAAYLHAIDALRRQGGGLWLDPALAERADEVGKPHVEKIRAILEAGRKIKATGGPNGGYMDLFLSPKSVLLNWDVPELGFGDRTKMRQRKEWLVVTKREAAPLPTPERFALWVYGNDLDSDDQKSEHDVYLVKPSGERVKVASLAPAGDAGNVVNKCYVIDGLSSADFLGDTAKVVVTNPGGEWTASRILGVYILPDTGKIASEEATGRMAAGPNDVRASALGFVEVAGRGVLNRDGEELVLDIDLSK